MSIEEIIDLAITEYGALFGASDKFEVKEGAYNELKGLFKGRKVFLAASTHPGEEKLISDLTNKIRQAKREFITIIVPRHPNRSKLVYELLKDNDSKSFTSLILIYAKPLAPSFETNLV